MTFVGCDDKPDDVVGSFDDDRMCGSFPCANVTDKEDLEGWRSRGGDMAEDDDGDENDALGDGEGDDEDEDGDD